MTLKGSYEVHHTAMSLHPNPLYPPLVGVHTNHPIENGTGTITCDSLLLLFLHVRRAGSWFEAEISLHSFIIKLCHQRLLFNQMVEVVTLSLLLF